MQESSWLVVAVELVGKSAAGYQATSKETVLLKQSRI
jgi:hypothetical protein